MPKDTSPNARGQSCADPCLVRLGNPSSVAFLIERECEMGAGVNHASMVRTVRYVGFPVGLTQMSGPVSPSTMITLVTANPAVGMSSKFCDNRVQLRIESTSTNILARQPDDGSLITLRCSGATILILFPPSSVCHPRQRPTWILAPCHNGIHPPNRFMAVYFAVVTVSLTPFLAFLELAFHSVPSFWSVLSFT